MNPTAVRRTSTRLADGRELVYFDDPGSSHPRDSDALRDRRPLPDRHPEPQLRWDPLLDEWVTLAAHRQDRTFLPPSDECPLCPSTPDRPTEIPAADYDVAVFENRFTSLATDAPPPGPLPGGEPVDRRPGHGRCEVVCFTADHKASFAELTPDRVRTVMAAWVDRTQALGRLDGVEQVFCFENRGEAIGVTLAHPHGQIYAFPFVTPRTARMVAAAARHRQRTGRDLFVDVVAAELAAGDRVVGESEHWVAFVPAAARWPFEVHLHPRVPVPDLPALSDAARDDFGPLYLDVLRRLDLLFDAPLPYIAGWHQAPRHTGRDLVRLHLQVFSIQRAAGRLKYLAGVESGMGAWINDVAPERAAHLLRTVGGEAP